MISFVVAAAAFATATKGLVELDWISINDPSAGSPTETLLRLLLPLSDKVYLTFRNMARNHVTVQKIHRTTQIGRSDGRCVQRAGT